MYLRFHHVLSLWLILFSSVLYYSLIEIFFVEVWDDIFKID